MISFEMYTYQIIYFIFRIRALFFAWINGDFYWEKLLCFESSHAFEKCNYLLPNKSISGQSGKVSLKWKFNFLNACYLFYCKRFVPENVYFLFFFWPHHAICNQKSIKQQQQQKTLIFRWNVRLMPEDFKRNAISISPAYLIKIYIS